MIYRDNNARHLRVLFKTHEHLSQWHDRQLIISNGGSLSMLWKNVERKNYPWNIGYIKAVNDPLWLYPVAATNSITLWNQYIEKSSSVHNVPALTPTTRTQSHYTFLVYPMPLIWILQLIHLTFVSYFSYGILCKFKLWVGLGKSWFMPKLSLKYLTGLVDQNCYHTAQVIRPLAELTGFNNVGSKD